MFLEGNLTSWKCSVGPNLDSNMIMLTLDKCILFIKSVCCFKTKRSHCVDSLLTLQKGVTNLPHLEKLLFLLCDEFTMVILSSSDRFGNVFDPLYLNQICIVNRFKFRFSFETCFTQVSVVYAALGPRVGGPWHKLMSFG